MKTLTINTNLRTDVRILFALDEEKESYCIMFNNRTIYIRTNEFGIVHYCYDESALKTTDLSKWRKKYSKLIIITEDCCTHTLNECDAQLQENIKNFLKRELNAKKSASNSQNHSSISDKTDHQTKSTTLQIVRKPRFNKIISLSEYEARMLRYDENYRLFRVAA